MTHVERYYYVFACHDMFIFRLCQHVISKWEFPSMWWVILLLLYRYKVVTCFYQQITILQSYLLHLLLLHQLHLHRRRLSLYLSMSILMFLYISFLFHKIEQVLLDIPAFHLTLILFCSLVRASDHRLVIFSTSGYFIISLTFFLFPLWVVILYIFLS